MDSVVGVVTLSEFDYLEEDIGKSSLKWTVPCARPGLPVAFVGKTLDPTQGQIVCALGFVKGETGKRYGRGRASFPLWWCEDVVWLKRPLYKADLVATDRQRLGTFGGFASYRLQGRGAGIRSVKQWCAFIDILARLNPRMQLDSYKTQRVPLGGVSSS